MVDHSTAMRIAGWVLTALVGWFMVTDLLPDLEQAAWAVKANAGLGIPANVVLWIGISGVVATLLYLLPWTSPLGALLLTGFLGGAVMTHVRVNGAAWDVGENVCIGVVAWLGLWLRDPRVRRLLPIRLA
jgi:protein-S-isoprenylcysteine O-methyltransferase Ste14